MSFEEPEEIDPLVGTLVSERYRILRKLGEGGMGRVYEAQHELIGKKVALKCLNAEFATHPVVVERFKREARAATAVGNEHIVDVTDLGDLPDGSPYIVMEHLDGRELADLIDEGPMSVGHATRILEQACDALAAAHAKGIVHRDLKPENIFLVRRGDNQDFVKVLDFGISKMKEPEDKSPSLTRTGMAMGTPQYMSPEQAQGLMSTDHRTDVYALGIILYRMLTGVVPFNAETFPMLIVQIVTQDAPSVLELRPDVPAGVDEIIRKALARDAGARFQSVTEFAAALAPFRDVETKPERSQGVVPRTRLSLDGTLPARVGATPPAVEARPSAAPTVGARKAPTPVDPSFGTGGTLLQGAGSSSATGATQLEADISGGGAWKKPALVVALVAVLGGVGFTLRPGTGGQAPPAPPVVESTPSGGETRAGTDETPPAGEGANEGDSPAEVRVRLSVQPPEARIFLNDQEFPNPLDSPRPRSLDPVRVRMELEGYQTLERMIVFDTDARLEMTLQADPAAAPDTARSTRPSSGHSGSTMSAMTSAMTTPPPPPPPSMMDGFRDTF